MHPVFECGVLGKNQKGAHSSNLRRTSIFKRGRGECVKRASYIGTITVYSIMFIVLSVNTILFPADAVAVQDDMFRHTCAIFRSCF
jgi:hypothetical protein